MGRKRPRGRRSPTRGKPRTHLRGVMETDPRGHGFVKTSAGEYFIPRSRISGAFDGDVVEIAPDRSSHGRPRSHEGRRKSDKPEARVVEVVERAHASLIGRFEVAEPFGVVVPLDPRLRHDVFTRLSDAPDVPDGAIVRVRITEFPTRRSAAFGVVEEVIGDAEDTTLLIEQIIASRKLPTSFSEEALAQAETAAVDGEAARREGYRDIRDRFIFTIDPVDARDFDDALSVDGVESLPDAPAGTAVRLGVHIADVSAYVMPGDAIDLDARERTTSVYLPDRVIPMIPEALSCGVCSLQPGEDRRCLTVDLYLDERFNLISSDIYPALMRSRVRLDYGQADRILEGESGEEEKLPAGASFAELERKLALADKIACARTRVRTRTGGLGFNTREAKVLLDERGEPERIDVRVKTRATTLIEEAMIFANETVAAWLEQAGFPCAFRDHEPPPADAISGLLPIFQEFSWFDRDLSRRLAVADPYAIQEVLRRVEGRKEEYLISTLLLRAQARARYSLENLGHYGLGLDAYCHFTSPIRRYPDLMVHRLVKLALARKEREAARGKDDLRTMCERCSERERIAEAASMDANKALICRLMEREIGSVFQSTISGVTSYGFYVELENCAEGLVPIRSLGQEYFVFDPIRMTLTGSDTNTRYRLGDEVSVRLQASDALLRRLTFALA